MKIPTAICIFSTLFFAACSSCPVMEIAEQGSFAVGGKVLKNSEGKTFHGDHAYVFYQIPPNARKYPLVFAHGVGQFSKTWETTPDGREGFQNIFLRRGFSTYLVETSPVEATQDVARKLRLFLRPLTRRSGSTISAWGVRYPIKPF